MLRTVIAVIAGYALIGVLVVFTDQLFSVAIQGFNSLATPPRYYFALSLLTDTFYSVLGGYLCAAIARSASKNATLALMIGGEIVGLVSMIAFWKTVPHWFGLALLVVYPPAIWIGSRLGSRDQRSMAADV
jgi:hypothetical protein